MKQNGGNWLMAKSRVQEYITGAMFELLEKKDYAHITVQDLVDRAGVCRASFYRNYFTMDEVIDRFLDGVFTEAYPREAMSPANVEECIRHFFKTALKYRRQLRVLLRRGLLDRVSVAFYHQTLEQIRHLQVLNNKYQPYFFSGASAAMLCAWVENDFAESPEEMARIFMGSLRGYMELA